MNKPQYDQIGIAMTCRSYEEYMRMFDLTDADLGEGAILDVAAGGSSFTAEARERGFEAYAVDPHYGSDISQWVREASDEITVSTAKLDRLKEHFRWDYYGSIERHHAGRVASLARFTEHSRQAAGSRIYIDGRLPRLPFSDNRFSFILCSHFMFLYADQFDFEFHKQSVRELMRIGRPGGKICIYPLISLQWKPYERLKELLAVVESHGSAAELKESKLPFMPGSEKFLQITV